MKYLEVPPLQVQELRAPDVVPREDVLILTETEVLQPGSNLLCPPEVNCQRWKSTSAVNAQSPAPDRLQPPPRHPAVTPKMPPATKTSQQWHLRCPQQPEGITQPQAQALCSSSVKETGALLKDMHYRRADYCQAVTSLLDTSVSQRNYTPPNPEGTPL